MIIWHTKFSQKSHFETIKSLLQISKCSQSYWFSRMNKTFGIATILYCLTEIYSMGLRILSGRIGEPLLNLNLKIQWHVVSAKQMEKE